MREMSALEGTWAVSARRPRIAGPVCMASATPLLYQN